MDNTTVVHTSIKPTDRLLTSTHPVTQLITFTPVMEATPPPNESETTGMQSIWGNLLQINVLSQAATIIVQSWADCPLKQYTNLTQ